MQKVTQVGVVSLAKVMGISGLLVGLLVGVPWGGIMILIGLMGGAAGGEEGGMMVLSGVGGG